MQCHSHAAQVWIGVNCVGLKNNNLCCLLASMASTLKCLVHTGWGLLNLQNLWKRSDIQQGTEVKVNVSCIDLHGQLLIFWLSVLLWRVKVGSVSLICFDEGRLLGLNTVAMKVRNQPITAHPHTKWPITTTKPENGQCNILKLCHSQIILGIQVLSQRHLIYSAIHTHFHLPYLHTHAHKEGISLLAP